MLDAYCSEQELAEIRYCQSILERLPFESVRKLQLKLFFGDEKLNKSAHIYRDFATRN